MGNPKFFNVTYLRQKRVIGHALLNGDGKGYIQIDGLVLELHPKVDGSWLETVCLAEELSEEGNMESDGFGS